VKDQSFNVGALLPGSEAPDEVFIYVAHWDHLGTGESEDPEEDVIYNGAVDNATGTAALIELANAFAAQPEPPRRSIAFLAVTAEESGLLGSKAYAADPAIPMNKTVGGVNIDAMSVYGPTEDIVVVGYGSSELEDILGEAASEQDRRVEPEPKPERGYYYRSDHFNFAKKGVPMLYAESGLEHRELGRAFMEAKIQEYTDIRYHQPDDEVQDDWDLRGVMEDIELYYEIGREVADSEIWPQWYEGNEFRAIREDSLP
jgi:Zn-dependent M28 family amino/carboxypeptidase